jgi:hypothetical protein
VKIKIQQVEPQIAQKLDNHFKSVFEELRYHVPSGYRLRVSLMDAKKQKKRSNAAADNWSPASDRGEFWFEPSPRQANEVVDDAPVPRSDVGVPRSLRNIEGSNTDVHPAEADLLRALDRAESRPGWRFVPLKKFRDEILPTEHIKSMSTGVEQQKVLRLAIEKRFVLVGKVPNPKSPQFPVTTLRVNRLMPEVKAILGAGGDSDLDFHPIEIKGEPLSTTIMRERHR